MTINSKALQTFLGILPETELIFCDNSITFMLDDRYYEITGGGLLHEEKACAGVDSWYERVGEITDNDKMRQAFERG